jgi:hypothetical protein
MIVSAHPDGWEDHVRKPVDAFSILDEQPAWARPDENSLRIAMSMATRVGPYRPVVEQYLEAFSYAPVAHMRLLRARNARICFAPTILQGLKAEWAQGRRGRPLTSAEAWELRVGFTQEMGVVGAYASDVDGLIFPTTYRKADIDHVVLHELGHALTIGNATPRRSLLKQLPVEIQLRVDREAAASVAGAAVLEAQVLEALAEAYVWHVTGREAELPLSLQSELSLILASVFEDANIRFNLDDEESAYER